MTGYASATAGALAASETGTSSALASPPSASRPGGSVSVELRSVNSRFLDLSFRMPDEFRSLETPIRDLLTGRFRRGKIELRLNAKTDTDSAWPDPQPDQLIRLARVESTVHAWL